ncbi:MAG: AmmeMemoRadiSam system radical SAM enzyme [Gemmatimonadota bacterium]|nr:MAG: AmmeMemoRadiSam system radical SAM enzyme [Gemmatimonadota bacterium]
MSERKEALFYKRRDDGKIDCLLCPRGCRLAEGEVGACLGRKHENGILYADNYARTVSMAVDPIEKKPLYHFYPGKQILSIAPNGCNFACSYCQNWEISQTVVPTRELSPHQAVEAARRVRSVGIAYTYTEPLVWYEYLLDTGTLIHKAGMVNVLVTNGYINEEPLLKLLPIIDALNIDVKSQADSFYRSHCKGRLEPVLRTARIAKRSGCHVEVTNLLIPGLNDADEDIESMVEWVSDLGVDTPLHFSRYFPHYKCDLPPTSAETLQKAYAKAKERLRYVYIGNISVDGASNTYCFNCGSLLISRQGYTVHAAHLKMDRCAVCGAHADFRGV